MDLNEITIGQAREISSILNGEKNSPAIGNELIGKYVLVRSRNEGVNAGYIKEMDNTGVILTRARRIWYHKPADTKTAWYEGVAISGLSEDSKISCEVPMKAIIEDYSVTICTTEAENSIRNHKTHAQN